MVKRLEELYYPGDSKHLLYLDKKSETLQFKCCEWSTLLELQ
jgi:hypothetical protein